MPTGNEDRTFLDRALSLADQGIPVFPLAPGTKRPRFKKGHEFGDGFRSATTHKPTIRRMWRLGGYDCNIGIPTGPESGLFVIDVDNKGAGAAANDKAIHDALGLTEWPMSYLVLTPSGGWHRGYRCPPQADLLGIGTEQLGPGVDHRGPGGYVVAAGSVVDGTVYEVVVDVDELAELPAAVVDILTAKRAEDERQRAEPMTGPVGAPATFAELWTEVGITLRSGDQLYLCPFHNDHHPSLRINADTGAWFCHATSCLRHGGYRMLWREVRPSTKLPGGEGSLSDEDRRVLDACWALLDDITLFQTSSDHKAFTVLVRAAERKGSLALGVPIRWLGEEAGFNAWTSREVLRRLVGGGFIARAEVQGTTAHGYAICTPVARSDAETPQSYDAVGHGGLGIRGLGIRDVEVDALPTSNDALRHGGLGASYKTATYLMHQGKDTITGIQEALDYKASTTITRHLKTLMTGNFVIKEGDLYRWVTPDTETLDEYARLCGVAGKGEEARRQHAHDREGYQAHQDWLKERMTISRQLAKERRRNRRDVDELTIPGNDDPYTVIKGRRVDNTTGEVIDSTELEGGTP
jgi:hypothetical protein